MNPSRDDSSGYGEQHPQHQKVDLAGDEGKVSSDGKSERKFPWILHRLMEEAERENRQDVIAWMPSGNAFIVRKRDVFMKEILPRYFRQTKFKSFVRQLNLWGFLFIDHGPDKGSCKCGKRSTAFEFHFELCVCRTKNHHSCACLIDRLIQSLSSSYQSL